LQGAPGRPQELPLPVLGQTAGYLLELRELTKKFPARRELTSEDSSNSGQTFTAVKSVNLNLVPGEVLGLVGQSGSGKTTVGRLIVKLDVPTSGQILFEGRDINELKGKDLMTFRAEVQMIFQDPYESLNPRLSTRNSVEEPLIIHGIRNPEERLSRVNEMLTRVGLTPERFCRLRPHELSGGQRQRVAIARALILKPKLIVADEPVSMLDVSVSAEILNLLFDLKKQMNVAYLFITHNLEHAAYFSDRIAVMHGGQIVELDAAEKILKEPKHEYTRLLLASIPSYVRKKRE
jgi:peptide/nickel transport system ATP-binding protein